MPTSDTLAGTAIAVAATLDIEAVYVHRKDGELPPEIQTALASLGDSDLFAVCRHAIKTQRHLIEQRDDMQQEFFRERPWLLAPFLSTLSS